MGVNMENIKYLIQDEYNNKYGFRVDTTSGRDLAYFLNRDDAIKFCETICGGAAWLNKKFPSVPNQVWEGK